MIDPAILRTLGRIEETAVEPVLRELSRYFASPKDSNGVTIFIPNWNQRPYLPRAIQSALDALDELDRKGFAGELVIVDDASRDGSQKLLRSLEMARADERVATLFLPYNIGLPRVRNAGLGLARYRHLLFLDGDNEIEPANLALFLQAMRDTGAALVYGNLLERSGGDVVGVRSNRRPTMELFDENYIDAFALFDAEQVSLAGGFAALPQLYGWEDWELVLHLIECGLDIVFVPAVMGYYSISPRSMLLETNMRAEERYELIQRIHAPAGRRGWDPRRIGRIYDPAIGFLDED